VIEVGSSTVKAQGAQGGEPWSAPTPPLPDPAIPARTPTLEGVDPALLPDGPDQAIDAGAVRLEATPIFDTSISASELITRGKADLAAGRMVPARFALNTALARTQDPAASADLRGILSTINEGVFLGSDILPDDPCARLIEIQDGDSFLKLGRTYGVPAAFIQSINPSIPPEKLKPLTGVKIVQGPFHLRIIKHERRLDLYARDIFVRSFTVEFPEGNALPGGQYGIAPGTKLDLGGTRIWIGFEGYETATQDITAGWIFGSAGPRGSTQRDRASGIELADSDLAVLYNVLSEGRSRLRVEP